MAFLEVRNLIKNFGDVSVLKGVSFSLERGEVLAVLGASGNGKTTLLRTLNFLEQADGGEVFLGGERFLTGGKRETEDVLRKKRLKMGLVFQNFQLFPQYTALENVCLAPNALLKKEASGGRKLLAKKREENRNKAEELLTRMGLRDKMNCYPYQLSGGQSQRVAIARALALSPEILCFDEPTSALDPELTGEVLKVIRGLKEEGRTMILVTHEMEFARNVADRVLFMADGVAEAFGTPEEVMGGGKFASFYGGV